MVYILLAVSNVLLLGGLLVYVHFHNKEKNTAVGLALMVGLGLYAIAK